MPPRSPIPHEFKNLDWIMASAGDAAVDGASFHSHRKMLGTSTWRSANVRLLPASFVVGSVARPCRCRGNEAARTGVLLLLCVERLWLLWLWLLLQSS